MSAKPGEAVVGDSGVPAEWASGAPITDPNSGQLNAIEPVAPVKASGFVPYRVKPPRNWVNWLLRRNYDWQQYFDATCQRTAVRFVASATASDDAKRMCDYLCTGINDATLIRAALADAAADGGLVQLSEGTFVLATADPANPGICLAPAANVVLRGAGRATQLAPLGAVNMDMISPVGDGVEIRDLDIDGTTGGGLQGGIYLNGRQDCVVDNVRVVDMIGAFPATGYGVRIVNGADCRLSRCYVGGCAGYGILATETAPAIRRHRVEDCDVRNCCAGGYQVSWTSGHGEIHRLNMTHSAVAAGGLFVGGAEAVVARRLTSVGLPGGAQNGVYVSAGATYPEVHNADLWSCDYEDAGAGGKVWDVRLIDPPRGVVATGNGVEVARCRIAGALGAGAAIAIGNAITGADRARVVGCYVNTAQGDGIGFNNCDDFVCDANSIHNTGLGGAANAASVLVVGSAGGSVTGNVLRAPGAGANTYPVVLGAGIANATDIYVSGNHLHAGTGGATAEGFVNVFVGSTAFGDDGWALVAPPLNTVLASNRQL